MRKITRIVLGFLLLAVGLVLSLPGVPGPGIAIIIVGLVLLSDHFEWARRSLEWARQKAERMRDRVMRKAPAGEQHEKRPQ